MVTVELNNVKLEIPESWSDIKLPRYEKLYMQKPETKLDMVRFVADVCGIDANLLLESPAQVFNALAEIVDFVFDSELPPANAIKVGDTEYFVSFADKLSLGEWVDAENVIGSDSECKLSELLAILCRPIGENYNPDLLGERTKMFKKKEYEAILNHYSTVMAQAARFLKDTKTFATNGDGIKRLPIWQRIRYTYLIRSLEKQLAKCSDFSSTK